MARALYSTPLRTDPSTGAVVPGLCTAWTASRRLPALDVHLPLGSGDRRRPATGRAPRRRTGALALRPDAAVSAPSASRLDVRLAYPWRRFPYALTVVGAAPRFVPGPFRLVSGSKRLVVLRREGLTLQVQRLPALAAMRKFERGELDEAPVPLGDIVADEGRLAASASASRARTLLGIDHVDFAGWSERFRRVYWETADRRDYEQLISGARGFVALTASSAANRLGPRDFRRARGCDPVASQAAALVLRAAGPGAARRRKASVRTVARRRPRSHALAQRPGGQGECGHRADNRRLSAGRRRFRPSSCCGTSLVRAALLLARACARHSQRPELQRLDDADAPPRFGDPDRLGRRRAPRLAATGRLARGRARERRLLGGQIPGFEPTPVTVKRSDAIAGVSTPYG